MQVTPHFSYSEMVTTETGLPNIPTPHQAVMMGVTATRMEKVRGILRNNTIRVSSWFRAISVNRKVGGSATSDHIDGVAVDFTCPGFGDNYAVACAIRDSDLEFDQLILEYGWVHLGFGDKMRRQCLTKKSASAPYLAGLVK